jgi:hypothetical protein
MGIEGGLGWTSMSVDDSGGTLRDIRSDCTNLQWATPRAVQDITTIDMSANARLLLLADMTLTLNGGFDDAADKAHAVFKTVSSTSVAREILLVVSGNRLGTTPQVTLIPTDYQVTRDASGALTWSVPLSLANGVVPTWDTV